MKILLDHQCFQVQPYGGVSRYFVSLLRAMRELPDLSCDVVAPAHINEYLTPSDARNPLTFKLSHPRRGLRYRPRLAAPLFWLGACWRRPDLVHETHYILEGGHVPRGLPIVTTCHDMIVEEHGDGSVRSQATIALKRRSLERAQGIICISESTRADLLNCYPALAPKVSVVHHGVEIVQPLTELPIKLPESFLLYVGVRSGYKNFGAVVRAFGAQGPALRDVHLVCFGGGPLLPAEHQMMVDAGLGLDRVHQVGGDDRLLASVYRRALALVYPSLKEGFGMPLTEAMVQGCPVLCGAVSCFPEICGDAADYFDPKDDESIGYTLRRLVEREDRRAELRRLGLARGADFTWSSCAEHTVATYRRLVG